MCRGAGLQGSRWLRPIRDGEVPRDQVRPVFGHAAAPAEAQRSHAALLQTGTPTDHAEENQEERKAAIVPGWYGTGRNAAGFAYSTKYPEATPRPNQATKEERISLRKPFFLMCCG